MFTESFPSIYTDVQSVPKKKPQEPHILNVTLRTKVTNVAWGTIDNLNFEIYSQIRLLSRLSLFQSPSRITSHSLPVMKSYVRRYLQKTEIIIRYLSRHSAQWHSFLVFRVSITNHVGDGPRGAVAHNVRKFSRRADLKNLGLMIVLTR